MPKQVLIESRNQTIDFPDDATQEEIDQYIAQEFPRTGEDVAYDLSKYTNAADLRDFIAAIPDEDYIKLNNYRADKKLSWGELAGIAGEAFGTIVGDAVSGVKNAATKAGEGVIESAARGVGAGTIDLVTLGQKLVTPNERIPTLEEFVQTTKDQPTETIADETFPFSFGRKQVLNTEADYKSFIDRQRFNELQALDLAEASEKLIKGAPVPEVAKGASYLDAIALAGLARSIAKAGVKTIYKKAATAAVPSPAPAAAFSTVEQGGTFIPAGIRQNAENFASKVGEGARKAGFTGVEFGAKGVKTAADLGKGVIDVANELGLKNAAVRGAIAAGIGYQEGGNDQAMLYGILGTALPVAARKGLAFTSGAADFIGAAAKVRKSGPARAGWLERMASSADISPEARAVAEKALFVQPFTQLASDTVKKAAKNALLGATVGTALGYAADGEQGAAAGFGSGLAIGTLSGPLEAGIDAIKTLAGQSTSRTRANAVGDIRSFVNSIADDQARTAYAEVMNKAIEVAGPERAADMLDNLRLAEAMGATVEVVPVGKRKDAFNAFEQKGPAGGTITINPDRMTAGTVSHETFHQLLNVGLKAEIQKALSDVYLPKVDEAGNVIRPGLFSDAELAKKAEQLAARYANNPRGYKQSLEYAETLNNQAGRTPEEINEARMFLIDEMTAEYAESFMGRSRPGVFNPDRLPLWHRQILQGIDDMVLNKITDKVYGNKNIKDPTAAFVDEQGKPIRVPQLDAVLKRAFSNKMNRSRGTSAKPKEIVVPTNPRDLVAWASTFGSTRDVLKQDENGNPAILTKQEQKAITAADFEEAKTVYQGLPPEAKQTVRVTNKAGSPIDINNKGARIQITSKTPEDVFNAFLEAAKKRGMGNQQLANMRQLYASMISEDGPIFNTVNNPVYEYDKKTGTMKATVRPPTRQEIYPTAITINSAGGFNVDYIDLSRVKANAEKILENPKYKGVWQDLDGFMNDFRKSLKNLSSTDRIPTADLLGKGNAKMGATKRDLIAEAMNVTLPKRLETEGYINEPTIDPLTLLTNEGKERRIGGSAFRDFRIERLTEVTPTSERMKMVKEDAYDILVQRFQPDAFARETLPAGETLTNPDGYRILKKAGSKLYRVYDDKGELIGTTSTEKAAMRKGQDDFAKKVSREEPAMIRFQFAGESAELPQFMRDSLEAAKAMAKEGKTSEVIRAITGWFPGKYDDKMRWEVPDQEAKWNRFFDWINSSEPLNLGDILNHPDLYAAYPEAQQIKVNIDPAPAQSARGSFNPDGTITLGTGYLSLLPVSKFEPATLSTLLHEVQHWIQDKEGFARGSGPEEMGLRRARSKALDNMLIEREREILGMSAMEADNIAIKTGGMAALEAVQSKLDSDAEWNNIKQELNRYKRTGFLSSEEQYRRTAGEIESRDIQARQSFTPEQRKAIAPYSSENIAREEAIVLKSAKKASQEERQTRFQPESPYIRFQPDALSPNIQVGSNGTRIIKSPSGKFRVYSVTGTLLGIRETEQAAKKLATK